MYRHMSTFKATNVCFCYVSDFSRGWVLPEASCTGDGEECQHPDVRHRGQRTQRQDDGQGASRVRHGCAMQLVLNLYHEESYYSYDFTFLIFQKAEWRHLRYSHFVPWKNKPESLFFADENNESHHHLYLWRLVICYIISLQYIPTVVQSVMCSLISLQSTRTVEQSVMCSLISLQSTLTVEQSVMCPLISLQSTLTVEQSAVTAMLCTFIVYTV